MRRSADFEATVRRGARAGRGTLVVHCRAVPDAGTRTRVGLVVSRAVGGAVVRNKVRRRLRGVVVEQRATLPAGADVVVRALPPAAAADYASLSEDLRSALRSAARKAGLTVGAAPLEGAGR
jgi:ribonuclease P protein component